MKKATVVIPNLNGMKYLENCLMSLREQDTDDFETILVDNGSTDESVAYVEHTFPEVQIHRFDTNTGFCKAVNAGITMSETPYVILLNNDTICRPQFVRNLIRAMEAHPRTFACSAKMLQMNDQDLIDDAGDLYCALGWAFARGKGKPAQEYDRPARVFAVCGGAAIYRRSVLEEIGLFDEAHFAYLEDIDLGWRARIRGYENRYEPSAQVVHAGSATTGSRWNVFKTEHTSRNSIYLIRKNMPVGMVILNSPFLLAGFLVKTLFFTAKGFGPVYLKGLARGMRMETTATRVPFRLKDLPNHLRIQAELWGNTVRRLKER